MPKLLYTLLASLVFLSACVSTPVPTGRIVISEEDSKIVFYDPEVVELESQFFLDRSARRNHKHYLNIWRHPSRNFPHVRMQYTQLGEGYHFPKMFQTKDYIDRLNFGDDIPIQALSSGYLDSILGRIKYQRFAVGDVACVAIGRAWKDRHIFAATTSGNKLIEGHFCGPTGENLASYRIQEIVSNIGVKGTAIPQPSTEWKAARAKHKRIETVEIPISFQWPAFGGQLSGKFIRTAGGAKGKLWLSPAQGIDCSGDWKYLTGKFDSDNLPQGQWSLLCNNGKNAVGTYIFTDRKHADGTGKDEEDSPLSFSFTVPD